MAGIWEARSGQAAHLMLCQRSYSAEQALEPEGVQGTMRPYEERDRELVLAWMDAFVEEALPEAPPEDSAHWLDRRAADPDSGTAIWEDGEPVSMGGYGGLTPNGIRVGPIYTPPELRRRGYASALTAAMTRMLLEGGPSLSSPSSARSFSFPPAAVTISAPAARSASTRPRSAARDTTTTSGASGAVRTSLV